MLHQTLESAYSRIANGNFSNGKSFWEGIDEILAYDGDVDNGDRPRCRAKVMAGFRHEIQYLDLSVYPSPIRFSSGTFLPASREEVLVKDLIPPTSDFHPFDYVTQEGTRIMVPAGEPVTVDTTDYSMSGEYRTGKIVNASTAIMRKLGGLPAIIDSSYCLASYARQLFMANPSFRVSIERMDPSIQPGQYFVGDMPRFSARIISIVGNILTVVADVYGPPPKATGSYSVWAPINGWKIVAPFTGHLLRTAPACLYDLTLAYSLAPGHSMNFDGTRIEFEDEFGTVFASIPPFPIGPAGENYFTKTVNNTIRVVQRFVKEVDRPYYGKAFVRFVNSGESYIGDVCLFRGNYTSRFLQNDASPVESYDLLETPVCVESEIIPKGTIIAYAGGSACPSGFIRVEGIGTDAGRLTDIKALFSTMGVDWIHDWSVDYRISRSEPRTMIRLHNVDRATALPLQSYHTSGRFVNVDPYRYDADHQLHSQHTGLRSDIGDPEPIWVDENYEHVDVLPGYILEIKLSTGESAYAIISQFSQANVVTRIYEKQPTYPFGKDAWHAPGESYYHYEDDMRRARRQIGAGNSRNGVFGWYQIYGELITLREDQTWMELVGDWTKFLDWARHDHSEAIVWKSGVLAHAASLPEVGSNYPGSGGYSYFGEPHAHRTSRTNAMITQEIGQEGDGTAEIKVPFRHTHGALFGAATLPKVRPVLLCQKL